MNQNQLERKVDASKKTLAHTTVTGNKTNTHNSLKILWKPVKTREMPAGNIVITGWTWC